MWAFFAYLIAAVAFYTVLVLIAQPEPYEYEAWEMSDDAELPVYTAAEEPEVEVYQKAA